MNLYLKLFLAMGISFGIFMGIFYSFQFGFPLGMGIGMVTGIFFGGLISLILGFLHNQSVKRISSGKYKQTLSVHHTRHVKLRLPYDRVFDLCLESLTSIEKCKIQKEDRHEGRIIAKAVMTWKTWGDVILFKIQRISNDEIQVEVSSRPALRTTLVDYGKNLENVQKIVRFLNAYSENTI